MSDLETLDSQDQPSGKSFLIIHRGPARRSVVPLFPGEIMTLGRANSNRIVIPDAKCSRHHCEVFHSDGQWHVRDLDSRNGVLIDGVEIKREQPLEPGQVLLVGACEIQFTDQVPEGARVAAAATESTEAEAFDIIERASGTRFDKPLAKQDASNGAAGSAPAELSPSSTKPGLDELYHLARSMAGAKDTASLAQETLDGLFAGTGATIGAILLLPAASVDPDPALLERIAFQSTDGTQNKAVSSYLSQVVLQEREALLARDVSQQESLPDRDSLGHLAAASVICTPIRRGEELFGVVHLYATDSERPLDANDLEFVLAVSDQFAIALDNVRDREELQQGLSRVNQQNVELLQQLEVETELVGNSEQMQALRQKIGRIAPSEALVLIRGESGVGKELVARAVHFNSSRREGAFVCVNCAALTESLLESELFGHEKGSFTGASARKVGKFEQADGGSLFLDEVGEMSPEIQSKFLRVLEGHPFERVGGSQAIEVDVRVVTATNRDLESAVKEGEFREDLFYRLQVLELRVPSLREHPEDIEPIAHHFLARTAGKSTARVKGFTPEALAVLREYHWPGNVRELKNVIERSVILSDHEWMTDADIRLLNLDLTDRAADDDVQRDTASTQDPHLDHEETANPWSGVVNQEASLEEMEEQFITAMLEKHGWNKSATARQLGIERTTLDRKIKKYEIERAD